ncbi:NACHT domain-containing protein [Streptomyces sp. PmtG]
MSGCPPPAPEDTDFERRYADYVVGQHSTLTIHGVDLHDARSQAWPLETAYLSLEAVPARDGAEPVPGSGDADGRGAEPDPESDSEAERATGPVEAALAAHDRVLLRGVAGTGKTTLVQWLALTTARQDRVPGHLPQLLGRVPFVLPLRALAREDAELPLPEGFLPWIGCPLSGSEPAGWAVRVLQAGRGVLLIDGVDEIPEAERPRARAWLARLRATFPGNLWLVTTRPSALPRGWLGHEGFREFTLTPMRPAYVRRFVGRWHDAAHADGELAAALLRSLRASAELGHLATNPLLCALICALHRERRGFLPQGRVALYEAALSMLLERRDRERDLYGRRQPKLDQKSATEPLKRLAYWLIRNGRTSLERETALDLVERLRPSVPQLARAGAAEDVLRLLLDRSGLLREPAEGAVAFIHRTFQDFLGAKAALEEHDIGALVGHAHLDQWEDVLQMAVAQARPDERAELLTRLTSRADREPDDTVRARLRLLALASLDQATRLDPGVRATVRGARRAAPAAPRHARGAGPGRDRGAAPRSAARGRDPHGRRRGDDRARDLPHRRRRGAGPPSRVPRQRAARGARPAPRPLGPLRHRRVRRGDHQAAARHRRGRGRHGAFGGRAEGAERADGVRTRGPARRLRRGGDPRRARPGPPARAAAARQPERHRP